MTAAALPAGFAEGLDGPVEVSRWCPDCRELVLAHDTTGCCLWCSTETLPAIAGATERGDGMSTTAVETQTCKIEGCTDEPYAKVGMYGGLCTRHADEAREARRANGSGGGNASRPRSSSAAGLTGKVRTLVPLARKVDRSRTRASALPSTERAEAELAEAIRRVQGAQNAANLARLEEATKALKSLQPAREKAAADQADAEREFRAALSLIVESLRS